jgi:HlyD family secretion protein
MLYREAPRPRSVGLPACASALSSPPRSVGLPACASAFSPPPRGVGLLACASAPSTPPRGVGLPACASAPSSILLRPSTAPERFYRGLPSLLALAALALALAGCNKKEEEKPEPIAPVQVGPVTTGDIRKLVTADAVLFPVNQADIIPKVTAPVAAFNANRGDHVRAGEVLARLENRDLVAAAAAAKAQTEQADANLRATSGANIPDQVVKAQADLNAAQEQLDAARTVLESRKKLFEEGALAKKLVDDQQVAVAQAQAQYESAQEHLRAFQAVGKDEQIKGAQAQVDAAKAQYQSAQAQVDYTEVTSPISGVVADRPLYVGNVAQAGTPLFTIVDISSVVARANVPQLQASSVKVGQQATLQLSDGSLELPAKVTVVSPSTDPASTTVQVWVQAANPRERLKPGTSVRVTIVTATLKDVTLVPASAILPGEEGGTVVDAIGAGNTIHQKKVEVGVREPDKAQILSGVSPGDQVVTVGGLGLDDNSKVRIVKPGEEEEAAPEPEPPAGGKAPAAGDKK